MISMCLVLDSTLAGGTGGPPTCQAKKGQLHELGLSSFWKDIIYEELGLPYKFPGCYPRLYLTIASEKNFISDQMP